MSIILQKLVEELTILPRKSSTSYRDTEFMIPYVQKRSLLDRLSSYSFTNPPTKTDVALLTTILTQMNQYEIYDPVLLQLFSYLCEHTSKESLTTCMYIKNYPSPDVVPQPYYQQIKKYVSNQGLVLGDLNFAYIDVVFMIGKVIGFVIYLENKVFCSQFDSELIQRTYQEQTKRNW